MEKFKKYSKTLGVILICMTVFSPAFGSSPGDGSSNGMKNDPEEKQTQEKIISKKFEDLEIEYQEKAKRLGYKESDMVEMRKESDGKLTILPPSQEIMTPEKLREKFLAMVSEKFVQKMTDEQVQLKFTLATDLTGYMTALTKFENLREEYQEESQKEGYKTGDTVEIRVDATTWKIHIIPAQRKEKIKGKVLDIIPAKEHGGRPSYRCLLPFEGFPEDLQKQVEAAGYKPNESVMFIYHEESKKYDFLPPLFLFGTDKGTKGKILEIIPAKEPGVSPSYRCSLPFKRLPKDLRKRAKGLGYKKRDSVRLIYHTPTGKYELLSPPLYIGLLCKWEGLSKDEQTKAAGMGYKEGGTVWKSSDAKGNWSIRAGNVTATATIMDGRLRMVITPKGWFDIVPPEKVGPGPMMTITHILHYSPSPIFRCITKFQDISKQDKIIALAAGYTKEDEILVYYYTHTKSFKVQPPPKE